MEAAEGTRPDEEHVFDRFQAVKLLQLSLVKSGQSAVDKLPF